MNDTPTEIDTIDDRQQLRDCAVTASALMNIGTGQPDGYEGIGLSY